MRGHYHAAMPRTARRRWGAALAVAAFGVAWAPLWATQAWRNPDIAWWLTVLLAIALGFATRPNLEWTTVGALIGGFMVGGLLLVATGQARNLPACAAGLSCVLNQLKAIVFVLGIVGLVYAIPIATGSFLSGVLERLKVGQLSPAQAVARWIAVGFLLVGFSGWGSALRLLLLPLAPAIIWSADRWFRPRAPLQA